jgi:hypothetical protein
MRKNNTKIMVVVLIIIMVGFVIGASLPVIINQFADRIARAKAMAHYGDNIKISEKDYSEARTDLTILQAVLADKYLQIAPSPTGNINFKTMLLGQMLFPDQQAPAISNAMKQSLRRGELQVASSDIDNFFIQLNNAPPEFYWMLLSAEAKDAGCAVLPDQAAGLLRQIINYFGQGRSASQLINYIITQQRVTENQIYNTFANLLAITSYIDIVTTGEDITTGQVRALIGLSEEKTSAQFVKIAVNKTSSQLPEGTDDELNKHFQKYKTFTAGEFSDQNPYGFGYKLPPAVELEYLIVKLDDVEKLIDKPSEEETEEFYRLNSKQPPISYQELKDPNDPESERITKTRDYTEVVNSIRQNIVLKRSTKRANMIMNDAVEITEEKLSTVDLSQSPVDTYEEFAIDYSQAADELREKHKVTIYAGKTGRLSRTDLISDPALGRLVVESQGGQGITMDKIAFAIKELGVTQLGRFDVAAPKLFQNIGPVKNTTGSMFALVRIIAVHQATEPQDINLSYSRKFAVVDTTEQSDEVYNVKDSITEDLKVVKGMEIAKAASEELLALIEEKGWDDAIKAFNDAREENEDSVIGTLRLATQQGKTRSSLIDEKLMELRTSDNPIMQKFKHFRIAGTMLTEKLYSMLPEGETEMLDIRKAFKFEPQTSYYVVKDVNKQLATEDKYYQDKNRLALLLDMNRSVSLTFVHLLPENLIKRNNFEFVTDEEEDDGKTSDDERKEEGRENKNGES